MRTFMSFMGLIFLGLVSIAAFSYPAWLLLHPHFTFPFHRMGERIGMLALAVGFLLTARHLGLNDRVSLGYGIPRPGFLREAAIGLALGAATMAAGVAIMAALGLFDWSPAGRLDPGSMVRLVSSRLVSAFAVAFIEETFLRGAMLCGIERESGAKAAVLLTAVVYSATHFFASFHIAPERVTAGSGLDLVSGTLALFAHPLAIADAFLCLFAVGVVLGSVRIATGNIAACVGLHAGWVWVILTVHEMAQPSPTAPLRFLLSGFDGFTGWLLLAWTILVGLVLRRLYSLRAAGASGARTSKR